MAMTVFEYYHIFVRFHFSSFSLVLVPIEKIYLTVAMVFYHISKHLKVSSKNSATGGFSTLFSMIGV